jgi:selT/selW/selH-like putative selenoprotein
VAELTQKYGKDKVTCELTAGSGGVFDVTLDGKLIFSKKQVGRFPTYGEIPLAIDMDLANR